MNGDLVQNAIDVLQLGGIGLILWRGGRWTKGIEAKLEFLCSRVRKLEVRFDESKE